MLSPTIPLLALLAAAAPGPQAGRYFAITVVDDQTGRGVPLVELETVNNIKLYTDSNGLVAFYEPGLMGQTLFFHVRSHGYEFPKDGFGYRGKALKVEEGGTAQLAIHRINVAERLYRMTGAGIYRDTLLLGRPAPIKNPALNGQVLGMDTVDTAVYRGKLYWTWGDTNRPGYPLGNFSMTGATSLLPGKGGLDPSVGVDLSIFTGPEGFARAMAPVPGPGPTWLGGMVVVPDAQGKERMFASYSKIRNMLETYERGLVEFDDRREQFLPVARWDLDAPLYPCGHSFLHRDGGVEWAYFCDPLPFTRVRATAEDVRDPSRWEGFTCLKESSTPAKPEFDRDAAGALRFVWRRGTAPASPANLAGWIKKGLVKPEDALCHFQDPDTGKAFVAHGGSVYWNDYRKRWVLVVSESMGTSMLGEVWYAEGDTIAGPWVYARKIVTHDRYTFYNPMQHPEFAQQGGRLIYFEGTYANTFSGNDFQTPRYDYNQMMYRLDLADARLNLPVPVYATGRVGKGPLAMASTPGMAAASRAPLFFALERAGKGTVPVYQERGILSAAQPAGPKVAPLFHVLPADAKDAPPTTVPLWEFAAGDGSRVYSTAGEVAGHTRAVQPLCRVWRSPLAPTLQFAVGAAR